MWQSQLHDDALYYIWAGGGPIVREGHAQQTGSNAIILIALLLSQMVVMAQIFMNVEIPQLVTISVVVFDTFIS